jgi:DNA-sulfur modification-associated
MATLKSMDLSGVTGAQRYDSYVAVRSTQGGRTLYTIQVRLSDVPLILPVPDPEKPTPGNRRVNPQHARKFGEYVRDKVDWVAPPLLARDDGRCAFKEQQSIDGEMALGILDVPWVSGASRALKIIDGQHRVLGIDLQIKDIEAGITRLEDDLLRAKDDAKKEQLTQRMSELKERHQRLLSEHFTLQIYVETEPKMFEQMFYDVADNALGINQAVKVRFDSRKVLNRTLYEATKHALLKDRVDEEQDRLRSNNPNLLGAKHVIDLVRTVNVGITGRIGRKREEELDESALIEAANDFFDCLLTGFPPLEDLVEGRLTAQELRDRSLLGSVSMLRVLAGVFHQLREDEQTDDEITEFFARLAPHMTAPVTEDSLWRTTAAKQDLPVGATGPTSLAQSLKRLTEEITKWYTHTPPGL